MAFKQLLLDNFKNIWGWKTQRKIGHLTRIDTTGELVQKIIDEDYKVNDKPIYNTTYIRNSLISNHVRLRRNIGVLYIWGCVGSSIATIPLVLNHSS